MKKEINEYFRIIKSLFGKVIVTDVNNKAHQLDEAINIAITMILNKANSGRKLLFIGNGASASISSHMAVDFWKNAGIRALAFNDSSLLTCISNDYGYKHVFEKPIEMFAEPNDIFIGISSSGRSENIIRGVQMARSKGCFIITLSGFNKNNPLRSLGDLNFYVPFSSYGPVEVLHHSICHCMLDSIVRKKNRKNKS